MAGQRSSTARSSRRVKPTSSGGGSAPTTSSGSPDGGALGSSMSSSLHPSERLAFTDHLWRSDRLAPASGRKPVAPARVGRAPRQLAPCLGVGGAAELGHHHLA